MHMSFSIMDLLLKQKGKGFMKYLLLALITGLLSIIGFYAILAFLIFTAGDSDSAILYAGAIVLGVLLIVIISLLVQIKDRVKRN